MDMKKLRGTFWDRAVPGIVALLLNSIYIVVDGLFVARLIGRDALAAVTVAVPVMEILIALAMLISVGAGVIISQHVGRGETEKARDTFNASVRIMLIASIAIAAFGVLLSGSISRWMGATSEIEPLVTTYVRYLFAFAPFLMFSFGLGTWARNDDQYKLASIAMACGTVVNIALDYVFIQWCGWGVGGAALATGLGPVVSCLVLLPHFIRGRGRLYFQRMRLRLAQAKAVLFAGIPSFLMEFALGLTTLCVNLAVSRHMGALGLAAYGVVGYVALIVTTFFLGMAEGTQPIFSLYQGRGDTKEIDALLRYSLRVCLLGGVGLYGVLLLFARVPAVIFGGQDTALVDLSVQAMGLYFPALFATGMNIQISSCLQSMGRWQRSAIISALRALVVLSVLLVVLPVLIGAGGVWLCVPLAECITLPIAWYLYAGLGRPAKQKGRLLTGGAHGGWQRQ